MTAEEVRRLPKAEVHVHLEGCFEPEDVRSLAEAAGVSTLPRAPEHLFSFVDLEGFLDLLDWVCGLVTTPEQVARLAYQLCLREASSGVVYADVIVNPTHWPAWHGRIDAFVEALDAGFGEAEQDGLPPVGLCLSLLRSQGASDAAELVDWMLERRHPRVVALSIDGNEAAAGRTGARFAEAFRRARSAGLHTTAHAGESSGPEGVLDAIRLLGAERIDHGVRASEDSAVMRELAARNIALGVCPHSNLVLGLYPDRATHPLETLRLAGVPVSINTDDPGLLACCLEEDYAASASAYGWDGDIVRDLARTSLLAAFCDDDLRTSALAALEAQG